MNDFLYPVNFNFKVPKTGVKLFLDIFKSGNDNAEFINSVNGGLFFDKTSSPNFFSHVEYLPKGRYFGRLTYKEYPPFLGSGDVPNPALFTEIKFAKSIFTGFENEGLSIEVIRNGFTEYPLGITIIGSFSSGQGSPYFDLDYSGVNSSGFFLFTGEIQENFQINLPIFNNNKWENNVNGELEFFIDPRGFPSTSLNTGINKSSFIIIDDDIPACVKNCYN
jgi:hypothetical protein